MSDAAGQTPKQATTTSLSLVAITAVMGIVPHWRNGKVRWAAGTVFGLTGIGGSLLGTHWNKSVNPNALLRQGDVVRIAEVPAPDARR